jgi:pyruvate dehydrogenase E2 component (dihydrolipoamide acetyltransferase)
VAKAVIMPKFGMTQEEATIVKWIVKEGDFVETDDPIAEVTTDKVNMEVGAPAEGYIGGIRFQEGDTVPVTKIIAYILAEGEDPPEIEETSAATAVSAPPVSQAETHSETSPATPVAQRLAEAKGIQLSTVKGSGSDGKITRKDIEIHMGSETAISTLHKKTPATPAARHVARERGVDLLSVEGSGPRGRIQEGDVRAATGKPAPRLASSTLAPSGEPIEVPLEGLRRTIAERMQASYQQAPHITFTADVDMSRAIEFRSFANARRPGGEKVSMTALIMKAVAWALTQHPQMNAYVTDDRVILFPDVHLGVAVAIDEGLIVPVVHFADRKGLYRVADEVNDLTRRGRECSLMPDDVAGGTFTVSNLGMFRVDHFNAILNPPQAGILAVGRTVRRIVPDEEDRPVVKPMMAITLSADHRAIDGVLAARFLEDICTALEEPGSVML